jgi:hypothetical protein
MTSSSQSMARRTPNGTRGGDRPRGERAQPPHSDDSHVVDPHDDVPRRRAEPPRLIDDARADAESILPRPRDRVPDEVPVARVLALLCAMSPATAPQ